MDNFVSLSHFLSLLFLSFVDDGIVLILDDNGKVYHQLTKTVGMIWNSAGVKAKTCVCVDSWELHFIVFIWPKSKRHRKRLYYTDPWFNFGDNLVSLYCFLSLLFLSCVDDCIVLTLDYNGKVYRQLHMKVGFIWNSKSHIYVCSWEYHFKVFIWPKIIEIEKGCIILIHG